MLGAFQQPQVVLADMAQLNTLPERELAGLAEVIKYALWVMKISWFGLKKIWMA